MGRCDLPEARRLPLQPCPISKSMFWPQTFRQEGDANQQFGDASILSYFWLKRHLSWYWYITLTWDFPHGYVHLSTLFFFRKVRGSILALMSIISTAGHFSSVGYGGWTHHLGYGNFFWIPKISKDLVGWLRRNTRFGRAQSNMSSWLRFLFVLFEGLKVVPMILEDDCSEPRHGVTATQITYSVAGFSELDLEI